jgi:hypothetical protein
MNTNSVNSIIQALQPRANKIGQAAHVTYASYYRQAVVTGLLEVVLSLVWLIVAIYSTTRFWRYCSKRIADKDTRFEERRAKGEQVYRSLEGLDTDNEQIARAMGVVIAAAVVITAMFVLPQGVLHLANPNYYAIHNLVSDVTGGGH